MKHNIVYLNSVICASFPELQEWLKEHHSTEESFESDIKKFWNEKLTRELTQIQQYKKQLLDFSEKEVPSRDKLLNLTKQLLSELKYPQTNYLETENKIIAYFSDIDEESLQSQAEQLLKKKELETLSDNASLYCKAGFNDQVALVIILPYSN